METVERNSTQVGIWLSRSLKAKIEEAARREGRSVSNFMRRLAERALTESEGRRGCSRAVF